MWARICFLRKSKIDPSWTQVCWFSMLIYLDVQFQKKAFFCLQVLYFLVRFSSSIEPNCEADMKKSSDILGFFSDMILPSHLILPPDPQPLAISLSTFLLLLTQFGSIGLIHILRNGVFKSLIISVP